MLAVLAIVGRPNVGKSTLFNVLTRTRDALVADVPGLTRDRKYGYTRIGDRPAVVIDTGGLVEGPDGVERLTATQTRKAIEDADRVLLVVDGRAGLTPPDLHVATQLRRSGKPVLLVVNKSEGLEPGTAVADFHSLGFGEPVAVSAAHAEGLEALMSRALDGFAAGTEEAAAPEENAIRVAVIGRPNVGKSTLINRLLGEERLIAFDKPGTTRDSVYVPFEREGQAYVLIDTAGVRRRARVHDTIEKYSIVKALQAIDEAQIVIGVLDAQESVSEQDASLLGLIATQGRGLVIAVNKWDGIAQRSARGDPGRSRPPARFPDLCARALHLRTPRNGCRRCDGFGQGRVPCGDARAADPGAHARARSRGHEPPAAAGARAAHQAALCPPGRPQSTRRRDTWQPDPARARCVPALSRELLPAGVPARGDADAYRVPHRRKPVRRPSQRAHAAAAAQAQPPGA